MRGKSFDVLTENRKANMTSVNGAPDWLTNVMSKGEKGNPRLTKGHLQKENYHLAK